MALSTVDNLSNNAQKIKGMILSEILLAGAIISVALASSTLVIGSLQSMLINAENAFEAGLKIRQEISLAHLLSIDDISNFVKTEGIFTTIFSSSYRNDFTRNILVDVSWLEGPFQKHRSYSSQIVDWQKASGAADCNWLDDAKGNLRAINFGTLNIDDFNPVTDVVALGDYVYVSTDGATSSLPDLYVIDVHDIKNPNIIAHINTGPGIASIAAADQYVFAANAGSYQMQIIDVIDPYHPTLISQAKLPGAIISGSSGFGQSVHFFDHKMYIGLVKNAGPEFFIVDVSDSQHPITLGSYEIGSTVNDIDVQGKRVTVVTPGQNSIILLDASNPQRISEISRSSLSGWQTQGAQSVKMIGDQIVVGRTLGGFYSPNPELLQLNRNLLNSTSTASTSLKMNASIENIFGFNDYIYLTTSDPDRGFQILKDDFSYGMILSSAFSSRGVALTCNNQAMYVVTQNDQDFFHIFTLTK